MELDKKLKHAVVVLAHDDMDTLVRLINGFDNDFDFYIHIDRKWVDFSECEMRKMIDGSITVNLYSWRHVKWGSIDIVRTQMKLVSHALAEKSYDYIHLMSGHDVLLKNCDEVKDFFRAHCGSEFMDCHQLPYLQWEQGSWERLIRIGLYDLLDYNKERGRNIIEAFIRLQRKIGYKRNIPNHYQRLFGGSNWMSLTAGCWKHILISYKKSFLRRLRFTFASDEVFFHTVIMNSIYSRNVTYDNLRLMCWSASGAVKTLTRYDWWNICKSKALFARKVYSGISEELVAWIEGSRSFCGDSIVKVLEDNNPMRRLDSGIEKMLKAVIDSLKIHSSCEFLCKNGIYVRFLRDNQVNAHGLDIDSATPEITQRLFPSGFHCHSVQLYKPLSTDISVDLSLVLVNWIIDDENANGVFINNLASVSKRYVLIRNIFRVGDRQDECGYNSDRGHFIQIDHLMERQGFMRNDTVSRILAGKISSHANGESAWLFYEKVI